MIILEKKKKKSKEKFPIVSKASAITRHSHALKKKEKIISTYEESIILLVLAGEEV